MCTLQDRVDSLQRDQVLRMNAAAQQACKEKEFYSCFVVRYEAGTWGLATAGRDRLCAHLRQQLSSAPINAEVITRPVEICVKQQAPYRGHVIFCLTETQARLAGGYGDGAECIARAVVEVLLKPAEELARRCVGGAVAELQAQCIAPLDLFSEVPPLRPKENMYGYIVDHGSPSARRRSSS